MVNINNKRLCESCFCEINGDEGVCPVCGFCADGYVPDPLALPIGAKLNDKILIGRVIGKGGFGITYLGYDMRMERIICVKEYYPNGIAYRATGRTEISVNDPKSKEAFDSGAEKFYAEAQMVAQFNGNPNIVSVYDYFKANNTVYLIMEFIKGVTLKNYIKKHGRLTDGQALFVMDKIAAALSITHSAGVLHRDISPDNIMICGDGKVKLIDFGAARQIMAESSSNLTVVMKPGYTPIEQYTKKGRQGAWTDIYSLGVSVYYALTEIIIDDPYARMDSDEEMEENSRGINSDLWAILKKCTMINSADRYGSAIDLRKALKSVTAPIKA
ncbi:MAG: serine/threonine protein kinase, partial [Ruminococcus sp.]|nr:serine/threonine protein kinase [Ruminococcus sp.]